MLKKRSALSIFIVAYAKYHKLPDDERSIIRSSILWLIVLIIIASITDTIRTANIHSDFSIFGIYILQYIRIIYTVLAIIIGIIVSVMAAIIFSIFDRLNILTPIENDMHIQIEQLSSNIDILNNGIESTLEKNRSDVDQIIEKFTNYDKYLIARLTFGFQSLVGVEGRKDLSSPEVEFEQRHFSIKLFTQAKAGSEIFYLNSFVTHYHLYGDAIRLALRNSANVRLLLMRPDVDCAAMKARYNDCYRNLNTSYKSYEDFVDEVRHSFQFFEKLKQESDQNKKHNENYGELLLRSYSVSLNSPMIFVKEDKSLKYPEVAYTGFYTNTVVTEMPYVEWRGGDRKIISKFFDVFEAKWREEDHSLS